MAHDSGIDVLIVGAGAAGLMAAICGRQAAPQRRIVIVEGAAKIGAKILVAGGGRCNVTHDEISEDAYAGSSRNAIKKVLRRFDVPQTIAFFETLGVTLKREATGKLFPTSDDAHTVRDALLNGARQAGVEIMNPYRVEAIRREGDSFVIFGSGSASQLTARRLILATGGRSLPKSGSDGHGHIIAESLGHTLTDHIFPALVPLILPGDHFIRQLSGITLPAALEVWSGSGKRLVAFTDSTLCTHFGLSGPSVLDISRYYTEAHLSDPGSTLTINWLPDFTPETLEADLLNTPRMLIGRYLTLKQALPERLARALCEIAAVDTASTTDRLSRELRRTLARTITRLTLPVQGDRGYNFAEVTAGGVPLREIRLETMESRLCAGLYLCGEICDVDGRIGGYNFQWAWASGYVAGTSAAE